MRVQPDWPMRPLTTMAIFRRGLRSCAWSAASRPAPPAPMISRSVSRDSSGSTGFQSFRDLGVADERGHAPVGPGEAERDDDDRGEARGARADLVEVEDDVPQAVEAVVERYEQERDVDGLHPRVGDPFLDDGE